MSALIHLANCHPLGDVVFQFLSLLRAIQHRLSPSCIPAKKKSDGAKSYDLGGQLTSPLRELMQPVNFSHNSPIVSPDMWHVAPSCPSSPQLPFQAIKCRLTCYDNTAHRLKPLFPAHLRKNMPR